MARTYLITERPDAILNIVDGTNVERNLYLSTQLMELGIPVVMAVNMVDIMEKAGDKIHIDKLSKKLGCEVVEISALKGTGVQKAAEKAVAAAGKKDASAESSRSSTHRLRECDPDRRRKNCLMILQKIRNVSSRSSFLKKMTRSKSR